MSYNLESKYIGNKCNVVINNGTEICGNLYYDQENDEFVVKYVVWDLGPSIRRRGTAIIPRANVSFIFILAED
jgi:hypothetical protein